MIVKCLAQENIKTAAAAGRLMLGEFDNWFDFINAGKSSEGPRRLRRAQARLDRHILAPEIDLFCKRNFVDMSIRKLAHIYRNISPDNEGIRIPLKLFEQKFAKFKPRALNGSPRHSTVEISLWGLQFEFPEAHFANDIREALKILDDANTKLIKYNNFDHPSALLCKNKISELISRQKLIKRSLMILSFSLIECYLNGLAWDYLDNSSGKFPLSKRSQTILEDKNVRFRDKLLKYQEIVFGEIFVDDKDQEIIFILDVMKRYRDSIMHPSPFSHPSDFGGLSKLERIYNLSDDDTRKSAHTAFSIVRRFENRRHGSVPPWTEI